MEALCPISRFAEWSTSSLACSGYDRVIRSPVTRAIVFALDSLQSGIERVWKCGTDPLSGPNGFYANHRIKASRDSGWIKGEEAISETSVQLRS